MTLASKTAVFTEKGYLVRILPAPDFYNLDMIVSKAVRRKALAFVWLESGVNLPNHGKGNYSRKCREFSKVGSLLIMSVELIQINHFAGKNSKSLLLVADSTTQIGEEALGLLIELLDLSLCGNELWYERNHQAYVASLSVLIALLCLLLVRNSLICEVQRNETLLRLK